MLVPLCDTSSADSKELVPQASAIVSRKPVSLALQHLVSDQTPPPLQRSSEIGFNLDAATKLFRQDIALDTERPWFEGLSCSVVFALDNCPQTNGGNFAKTDAFTNGGFKDTSPYFKAGWATILLGEDLQGVILRLGYLTGPVVCEITHPSCVGADEESVAAAKRFAIVHTLLLTLANPAPTVSVNFDALVTGFAAGRVFLCLDSSENISAVSRGPAHVLEQNACVSWQHIRSREQSPWNEAADRLAKTVVFEVSSAGKAGSLSFDWWKNLVLPHWAWICAMVPDCLYTKGFLKLDGGE